MTKIRRKIEATKLTEDIFETLTPVERNNLRVKALAASSFSDPDSLSLSKHWDEYWGEEKRALIREYKKEQLAISNAPVTPEVTPKSSWIEPYLREKEAVRDLTIKMNELPERATRMREDLRRSIRAHQKDMDKFQLRLEDEGIDIKNLIPSVTPEVTPANRKRNAEVIKSSPSRRKCPRITPKTPRLSR